MRWVCASLLSLLSLLSSQGVFTNIAAALAPFYQQLEIWFFILSDTIIRLSIGKKADAELVDLDGDGIADYEEPPSAWLYYLKGISGWIIIWLLTQFLFALAYQAIEPDSLDLFTAFYLCIVTATTVGYGDVGVRDAPGPRIFASFHILYSVSSLSALFNTVSVLHSERKIQLRKAALLQRQLDADLIQSLDKDNNGLDKLEFVVGMLTKLEVRIHGTRHTPYAHQTPLSLSDSSSVFSLVTQILHWDDVEPFLAQFDALDTDGSGRLDGSDLRKMVEEKRRKMEEKQLKKQGLAATPASASVEDGIEQTEVQKLGDTADSLEYGGVAAHNRNLVAAGCSPVSPVDGVSDAVRRKQNRPVSSFIPGIFAMQQRMGRPRRPRHLRGGKVGPG